jgi:hypothetical protein
MDAAAIRAVIAALGEAQVVAEDSVGQHLRSPATLLPAPPQMPGCSASQHLVALAASYALDEHIAVPVRQLAEHVASYEHHAAQAAERLTHDPSIAAVRRRRRLKIAAGIALAGLALVAGAAALVWRGIVVAGAQDRIDAALHTGDACSSETVSSGDLRHASDTQHRALQLARQECEGERAQQAYVERCQVLADHLASGKVEPADQFAAGAAWPLLQRLATGSLRGEDLQVSEDSMPCAGMRSRERLWKEYARAAGGSRAAWAEVEMLSPTVSKMLKDGVIQLSEPARLGLVYRVEAITKGAITSGLEEELNRARHLCGIVATLQPEPEPWCKGLARIDRSRK